MSPGPKRNGNEVVGGVTGQDDPGLSQSGSLLSPQTSSTTTLSPDYSYSESHDASPSNILSSIANFVNTIFRNSEVSNGPTPTGKTELNSRYSFAPVIGFLVIVCAALLVQILFVTRSCPPQVEIEPCDRESLLVQIEELQDEKTKSEANYEEMLRQAEMSSKRSLELHKEQLEGQADELRKVREESHKEIMKLQSELSDERMRYMNLQAHCAKQAWTWL